MKEQEQIICANCDVTPEDLSIEIPLSVGIHNGFTWYCSEACYEEKTKDEG